MILSMLVYRESGRILTARGKRSMPGVVADEAGWMSGLGTVGIERALNARFGFWRECGRIDTISFVELCVALAQDVTQERQLLLILSAEDADAEMQAHAQACVPGQRSVHRIRQQP